MSAESPESNERTPRKTEGSDRQENAVVTAVKGPTFAAAESPVEDLSRELVETLPRGDGELIRCRRILGDHYRCNWWGRASAVDYSNPEMGGLVVTTHRVIRSKMVRATRTAEGLVIESGTRQ